MSSKFKAGKTECVKQNSIHWGFMQLKTKGHVEGNAPEAECSHLHSFFDW